VSAAKERLATEDRNKARMKSKKYDFFIKLLKD